MQAAIFLLFIQTILRFGGNCDPRIQKEVEDNPTLEENQRTPNASGPRTFFRQASMTLASFKLQFLLDELATLDRFPCRLGDIPILDIDGSALPETVVWSNSPNTGFKSLFASVWGQIGTGANPAFILAGSTERARVVMAIDPAGRGRDRRRGAFWRNTEATSTSGERWKHAWLRRHRLRAHGKLPRMGCEYVIVEANFGDGMATALRAASPPSGDD